MGYPELKVIHDDILTQTYDLSVLVKAQIKPRFIFKSEPIKSSSRKGFDSSGLKIKSCNWGTVASRMTQPSEVCCFGLTLGNEIEETNKALGEKSLIKGFIWDSLCSILAEYYADQAEACLALYYKQQKLKITRRFSPGYCDLPLVPSQTAIFQFCDMDTIGVSLSASCLMAPRKSITGMVFAAEETAFRTPCSFCKRPCPYRRTSGELLTHDC